MRRGDVREWTLAQRVLGVGGVMLLALALERLINAAMSRGATTIAIALGFSAVFGLMGVVALTVVFVMRNVPRTSPQSGDRRETGANNRRARLGQ